MSQSTAQQPAWKKILREQYIGANLESISSKKGEAIESFIESQFTELFLLIEELPMRSHISDTTLKREESYLKKDILALKSKYIGGK